MFKVGDKVRVIKTGALGWECLDWAKIAYRDAGLKYPDSIATISTVMEDGEVCIADASYIINQEHFELINNKSKIMSNIKEFAKNLLLSKEEKMLREVGLKDSCGEYTDDAKELVIEKIVSENEEYLVSIAEKKLAESKK